MICSLENMLWFCGFTKVKTKKGLQFVIFPRKLDVVSWFDPREGEGGCSIRYVLSKICCGFMVSGKGAHTRISNLLCSLEKWVWFCGFTQVKTKKGLQFVILPRKLDVVLWFHLSEGEEGCSIRYVPSKICCGFVV